MSPGVVTVRHPGDPLYPAVVVLEPDGEEDSVSSTYHFTWVATGNGPLAAMLRVRRPGTEDPYQTLAPDIAMTDEGDGTWTGEYDWDVSELPEGFYYAEVTVSDPGGLTHSAYSRSTMSIRHSIDAGAGDIDAGGAGTPDASGPMGDDDGGEPKCGCRVGGRGGADVTPEVALGVLLLAALRLRGRRSGRAGPASRR
jgi:hypothetical protein